MNDRPAAIAVEKSGNIKLGGMSATYASIKHTCPTDCPFYPSQHPTLDDTKAGMKASCYALSGNVRFKVTALNTNDATADDAAIQEAAAIRRLTGKRVLRLHVSGDSATPAAAATVAEACEEHTEKAGQPVFGYTHAFKDVPRSAWGNVHIRASIQDEAEIPLLEVQGYTAFALAYTTSDRKPLTRAFTFGGKRVVPCPEMSGRAASCMACGLCFKTDVNIGFAGHAGARFGETGHGTLPLIEGR